MERTARQGTMSLKESSQLMKLYEEGLAGPPTSKGNKGRAGAAIRRSRRSRPYPKTVN